MRRFLYLVVQYLWGWGAFPHALLVLLSLWALSVQMTYRVPSRVVFWVLPWMGVAVTSLSLLIFINRLVTRPPAGSAAAALEALERRAFVLILGVIGANFAFPAWVGDWLHSLFLWVSLACAGVALVMFVHHLTVRVSSERTFRAFQWMEQWALLLVGAFVMYSVVLFLNGRLDRLEAVEQKSEALNIAGADLDLGGLVPYSWVDLRSWRTPGGIERIFLRRAERDTLWAGQPVLVRVRVGYLRIPWVSAVMRDEEKYYQQVIKIASTAAEPRKNLIHLYLDRHRWKDGVVATQEYIQVYPHDYEFVRGVASALWVARQHADSVVLLEPFLARQPKNYELLNLLGWGLARTGDAARGIELLKAAIQLDPDSWEAYYHLGYVHAYGGRYEEALPMFEKVLERRPNYPEIEQQLHDIRNRLRKGAASRR